MKVRTIDAEHQNLFRVAEELHKAMVAGKGKEVIGKCLDRLVQYTKGHFVHEERIMEQFGYPGFAAHKAEHDALVEQVYSLHREFCAGRTAMTIQVLQFLKNWLERHILGSDMRYAPYVKLG